MKSIFLLLLPAIVLCSCHTQKQEDESAHAVTLKGDIIHIGSESPVLSKLTKETVKQEPYRMEFTTSGVVQAIPSNYAEVASPVSGRITKSFVRLGQKWPRVVRSSRLALPLFMRRGNLITKLTKRWNWP